MWRHAVARVLSQLQGPAVEPVEGAQLVMEEPPEPGMGDIAFPLFLFAKRVRRSPAQLAQQLCTLLEEDTSMCAYGTPQARGPYLNVFLNKECVAAHTLDAIFAQGERYGHTQYLQGKRIMVEFSSPNTNKPLHVGHLRNNAIGESLSRIIAFCGADVFKVNIINDRGVHICKSMCAYQKFAHGKTPVHTGIKSDRFVGDWYVQFNRYAQQYPEEAEHDVRDLLQRWESADPHVRALWRTMNEWALRGIKQTYERTGISFDKLYFESETYTKGREEVRRGLACGVFYQMEDNSIWVDLSSLGLDEKALLRSDGTTMYITQDIGTAIFRAQDWPFDQLLYVVGNEQNYHFKVLFFVLRLLGYPWAQQLHHVSYGMVNLPHGRMKSREGTVVDADDILDRLHSAAEEEIAKKGRENALKHAQCIAENVAIAALHYFLLQVSPQKDIVFHPEESLSFNGNTGPYLQYMGARISSLLKKVQEDVEQKGPREVRCDPALLTHEAEWELVKALARFPACVTRAAQGHDPSVITGYLYTLSKSFSRFYHDCPILCEARPDYACARLELVRAVRIVLRTAMRLVLIPFLEEM